jgi:hypothetical protein
MTEESPDKLEVKLQYLEALRLAAYTSFNDRRNYEWKLSLAIWTALAVLLAGLVQPGEPGELFPFRGHRYGVAAFGAGFLIVLMHVYFNKGMAHANSIDRLKERIFSDLIKSNAGLEALIDAHSRQQKERKPEEERSDPEKLTALIKELPKPPEPGRSQWRGWGHLAQIRITILLTIAVVVLFWVKAVR